jgi:glutathione peroxidase
MEEGVTTTPGLSLSVLMAAGAAPGTTAASIYDFTMNDIDGKPVSLEAYRGKVFLVVNVASKCGFTYQYEGLEALYRKYRDRGFVILGFPSNDFLGQEPGTAAEIKQFCSLTYGVSFPMFEKIKVRGRKTHPLYAYLTEKKTDPSYSGAVSWNFNKFLIDRSGRIVGRFESKEEPLSERLTAAVEAALGS